MIHLIDELARLTREILGVLESIRGELDPQEPGRKDPLPPALEELLFAEPPPLDGDFDQRIAALYGLLWDHREDVLMRIYEPDRIYIGRALYKLLLELPSESRVGVASLLEAAKRRFFLHLRSRWSRIHIEEVATGAGGFQTVVKSTDVLLTGVLREMRQRGLLDEIETTV